MRNVTHHMSDRINYFKRLRDYLKPNGRVVVIEYKPGKSISFRRLFGHHVPEETIAREMDDAGFSLESKFGFLPEQHFAIFKKKAKELHNT
jgi:predicted methyltransferase